MRLRGRPARANRSFGVSAVVVTVVSWSGAIVFACSMVYGIHAYLVTYGVPAPPGADWASALVIDIALFSLFALHHSVLARTGLKQRVSALAGRELERPLYVWVASVLFLLCCWAWQPLPGVVYSWPDGWTVVPRGLQWAGALVTVLAARRLDAKELAGLRGPRTETAPRPLETRGLYRLVRHPIYLGWILLMVGTPVMTLTRAMFAVLSIAYVAAAVPFEERALVEVYGEAYRTYQRQVRARLVPGVY